MWCSIWNWMYKWGGGRFNILKRFIKVPLNMGRFRVKLFGKVYFKCSAVYWINTWKIFYTSFCVTIVSGSWTLYQQIKLRLNLPVCITVALYTCIQKMPVLTPAVPGNFFVPFCPSKSDFLDRTTISREELYCKLFPCSYQQHRGGTIKKVSNRISQTVKVGGI